MQPPGQPQILKPTISPWGKVLVFLVFGLIWNGIISVFIVKAAKDWMNGRPEWFLMIFLIPFVLVGIVVILAFLHSLLALANPRPTVALGNQPALGEVLRVGWMFAGSAHRIGTLVVTLEAKEEAKYRHGTSTSTDSSVFYRQELCHTTDPHQIREGRTEIQLPPDLVPSFSSKNNKVIWLVRLHGAIAGWPDVNDDFVIDVKPGRNIG